MGTTLYLRAIIDLYNDEKTASIDESCSEIFSAKEEVKLTCCLTEMDVCGTALNGKYSSVLKVPEFKWWLHCRNALTMDKKAELIARWGFRDLNLNSGTFKTEGSFPFRVTPGMSISVKQRVIFTSSLAEKIPTQLLSTFTVFSS